MASKYFHLIAHFPDEAAAERFARFYRGVTLRARPELSYLLKDFVCNVAVEKLSEREWRCRVVPHGNALVSAWDSGKDQLRGPKIESVAGGLYHHLRHAPTFEFAIAGFGQDDAAREHGFAALAADSAPGLVIPVRNWEASQMTAKARAKFVHFADGTVWIPRKD